MQPEGPIDPSAGVRDAVQNLMAARLGRAFLPLAVVGAVHFGRIVVGVPGALWVALGAVAATLTTLSYGLRVVQRALERPDRLWMSVAGATNLIGPAFGLYLLGWEGLGRMTLGAEPLTIVLAILHVAFGVWVLRTWWQVMEIERLARIMLMNPNQDGGST